MLVAGAIQLMHMAVVPATQRGYESAGAAFWAWARSPTVLEGGVDTISLTLALDYIVYLFDAGYGYDTANKFRSWLAQEEACLMGHCPISLDARLQRCLKGYRNATLDLRVATEPIRLAPVLDFLVSEKLRDMARVMVALVYGCLLCYSKVCDVLTGISWLEHVPGGWLLHLSRSKNDPLRRGTQVFFDEDIMPQQLVPWLERTTLRGDAWSLPSRRFWSRFLGGSVKHGRFHGFRHGRATDLISQGIPKKDIMFLGRWKSLEGMQAYSHM